MQILVFLQQRVTISGHASQIASDEVKSWRTLDQQKVEQSIAVNPEIVVVKTNKFQKKTLPSV